MLIYTKVVDGVKILFFNEDNVPTNDDQPLTYKDENGDIVPITEYNYFYNKLNELKIYDGMMAGESKVQLPSSEDIEVNVYAGDQLIIGIE